MLIPLIVYPPDCWPFLPVVLPPGDASSQCNAPQFSFQHGLVVLRKRSSFSSTRDASAATVFAGAVACIFPCNKFILQGYIYMCVCVCMCVRVLCINICVRLHAHLVSVYICLFCGLCVPLCACVCGYLCMHTCMHVCVRRGQVGSSVKGTTVNCMFVKSYVPELGSINASKQTSIFYI